MTLGQFITRYRGENNLSMGDFSKLAGISKAYISMLEKNKNTNNGKPIVPSLPTLKKVAAAMNMPLDKLMESLDREQAVAVPDAKERPDCAFKKSKDLSVMLEQLKKRLSAEKGLTYEGKPLTSRDVDEIINAMRIGAGVIVNQKK